VAARTGDARLLVVGSFGEGASGGLLAGTIAAALTGAARCPLAVVRGPEPDAAPPSDGPSSSVPTPVRRARPLWMLPRTSPLR
jgi:hypothetical protein